jgi:hypothetical protein
MRWGMTTSETKRYRERERRRFAFLPTQMDNGEWVWWEDYLKTQYQYFSRARGQVWGTNRFAIVEDERG